MDTIVSNYLGEICALGSAFLWAASSLLFNNLGKKINSLELTLTKGVIALVLLGISIFVLGESLANIPIVPMLMLMAGGVIGIGIGDTAFFKSMQYLGPRIALLLETLSPPMTAFLGAVFLGEKLSWISWMGILVTILGVGWVVTEKENGKNGVEIKNLKLGVLFGMLACLGQSIGAVISRAVMADSEVSALQTSFIRLFMGSIFLIVVLAVLRKPVLKWRKEKNAKKILFTVLAATVMGAFLGIWLQQAAFKYSMVGIAQTLTSTSPIFVLPIIALTGKKLSFRSIAGAVIAMLGIWMLFQ